MIKTNDIKSELLHTLRQNQKSISSKFFYDERGSSIYTKITKCQAYYPARTEMEILKAHGESIIDEAGKMIILLEPGSGNAEKSRILLNHLEPSSIYCPMDVSAGQLEKESAKLSSEYPHLHIEPVAGDFWAGLELPERVHYSPLNRVLFFPGSTIGNFTPDERRRWFDAHKKWIRPGGKLLLGFDLIKETSVLEQAYNDPGNLTSDFNKNLLVRINRLFGTDIDTESFTHHAPYNREKNRIEMYLICQKSQTWNLDGTLVHLEKGEKILTEYSHKFRLDDFQKEIESSGFTHLKTWTDPRRWFAFQAYQLNR